MSSPPIDSSTAGTDDGARAVVALIADSSATLAALDTTRETLAAFGVAASSIVLTDRDAAAGWEARGARAIVVASADTALAQAVASATRLLVIRVPTPNESQSGLSLLRDAIGDAPADPGAAAFPVATMAIGEAGARNAALFIVSVLALGDPALRQRLDDFREAQTQGVLDLPPLILD